METLERIQKHKGVLGVMVLNSSGGIEKTTFDDELTQLYGEHVQSLAALARSMVRELDPMNDLEFLRIRSVKHEIMVAAREAFTLIVVQDAAAAADDA